MQRAAGVKHAALRIALPLALSLGCAPAGPPNRPASSGAPPAARTAAAPPDPAPPCLLVREDYGPDGQVPLRVEVVTAGLRVPWGLAFLPGGDLLVTERSGRIRLVHDGRLRAQPVAEVPAVARAEGGLLGLALHPDFPRPRDFYIYYTTRAGGRAQNRVERWRLSDDATRASRVAVIAGGIPAARYHDGGRLAFGPDRMLYVGTGDATEPESSQRRDSTAGKILRLTPEGAIPGDNPWPRNPAFVTGVRNVEAFAWRRDGALVVADHGPTGELGRTGHDEVSLARAGDNLGWPTIYGCQSRPGMVTPALTWKEAVPPGGAAIYTGDAIPAWRGDLLIGTLRSRHLHRVRLSADGRVVLHEVYLRGDPPTGYGRLRTVAVGPDGALYVTTSNCDGRGTCPRDGDRILRITQRER